ncbi:Cadherin-like protein 28 [Heterocephalus glaber]|uniref:Cadherin-like protein 28 n=1 Tax=Heterocephalus glaber TaxID=10181 RepID=G5C231_HETGA|nr:Cadherin-like protein 28 [Heterocephalus glaber]
MPTISTTSPGDYNSGSDLSILKEFFILRAQLLFTTGVPKLDFEMVALYSLLIYARDNQGATASQTISIQIADVNEPPTFTGSLAQGDQGACGCPVSSRLVDVPASTVATVPAGPGALYSRNMGPVANERGTVVTATRLDAERAGFARAQSFSIKACDRDQRCAAVPVTAYIHGLNDNSPFCDQYVIRYTGREMIVEDTVVAKLSCRDLDDPPDTIHYVPSLGPVGSGQIFEQAPNAENVIRVTKELDYEDPEVVAVGHTYEMTISVFDDLHPSHTVTVTVIVELAPANDFSPVFKAAHYSFSVPETSGAVLKSSHTGFQEHGVELTDYESNGTGLTSVLLLVKTSAKSHN